MSRPQAFKDLPAALAAFAAGKCRRWVMVDGWQIDLAQARDEAGRVREEPGEIDPPKAICRAAIHMCNLEVHGNIAAELARAAHVLPELAVPEVPDASAHRCPWCSRPWDGAP